MDASASVVWNSLAWVGTGSTISLWYRTGETNPPGGTWISAPSSPTPLSVQSRYIQYRADLSTADTSITPVLESVTLTSALINYPPVITGQAALSTPEDAALTILLSNLTVTDVNNTYPTGFTLTVLDGTNYTHTGNTITPALNYNGSLTVPVKVNDGQADSNTF
ncbi:MAG TPA: hypothetical protein PJ988_14200, partial [Anaerolinea sp.]|nr:hypothetical protein [Anaerolinea sp.]